MFLKYYFAYILLVIILPEDDFFITLNIHNILLFKYITMPKNNLM